MEEFLSIRQWLCPLLELRVEDGPSGNTNDVERALAMYSADEGLSERWSRAVEADGGRLGDRVTEVLLDSFSPVVLGTANASSHIGKAMVVDVLVCVILVWTKL